MKTRHPEAARLENDYLSRIRAALAGRPEPEVAEVLQSVREHIEESATSMRGEEISLSAMAGIIEQLGPPEAYVVEESRTAISPSPPPVPAAPAVPEPQVDYVNKPFEFGSCFGDAVELYSRNFLPLLLASMVFSLLSAFSIFILTGPLWGGIVLMTLRAVDRADHKVDFGDMFRMFSRFWPLLGLFFIETGAVIVGLLFCVVPGLLLGTVWGITTYFMVEKGMGVFGSLGASFRTTTAPGRFLTNFLLTITVVVLCTAAGGIPYIGVVISWLVSPLTWFIFTLAYVRQTRTVVVSIERPGLLAPAVG